MARIRTIKPAFWSDGKTGTLSDRAKLLFMGMLNFADDFGILKYDIGELKARIFPYIYESPLDVVGRPLIDELIPRGIVAMFRTEDDSGNGTGGYLCIRNFSKHQKIDHPGPCIIPGLSEKDLAEMVDVTEQIQEFDEHSTNTREKILRKGRERKGREGSKSTACAGTFTPPSLEEVKAYCQERRNKVDPSRFWNFYEAKGWMVGRNKMKDWRAAVRGQWESEAGFNAPEVKAAIVEWSCKFCGSKTNPRSTAWEGDICIECEKKEASV